jgi:hypothetical protein
MNRAANRTSWGVILLAIALAAGLLWRISAAIFEFSDVDSFPPPAAGPFLDPAARPPVSLPPVETPGIRRLDYSEPIDPELAEFEIEAVNPRGEPIFDALVGLRAVRLSAATSTDAQGKGRLVARGSGLAIAHAAATGYLPEQTEVTLRQGERGKLRIVLAEATRLTVEVLDPEGAPMSGAKIRRFPPDGRELSTSALDTRFTNRSGQAIFDVPAGDVGSLQVESIAAATEVVSYAVGAEKSPVVRTTTRKGRGVSVRLYASDGSVSPFTGTLVLRTGEGLPIRVDFTSGDAQPKLQEGSTLALSPPPPDVLLIRRNLESHPIAPPQKRTIGPVKNGRDGVWIESDGVRRLVDPDTGEPVVPRKGGAPGARPGVEYTAEVELAQTWTVRLRTADGRSVDDAILERDPPDGPPRPATTDDLHFFSVDRCGLPASRAFRFRDAAGRVTPWQAANGPRPSHPLELVLGS